MENHSVLAMATILDPRYKNSLFSDNAAAAVTTKISELLKEMGSASEVLVIEEVSDRIEDDPFSILDEYYISARRNDPINNMPVELQRYLQEPIINRMRDPVDYWRKFNSESKLTKLALKYLCAMASSVPTERLFSVAGNVMTPLRSTLTPEHLSQLTFLHQITPEDFGLEE